MDGVDFEVGRGEIVGLLGPNGAGKTTVLGMVAGLSVPDGGSIELFGFRDGPRHPAVRSRAGFLQEKPRIYPEMSARAYLMLFAEIFRTPRPRERVDRLLAEVGLTEAADKPLGFYSRGMQQRACLARAMLHEPEFLVLDEPTLGLDPNGVSEMRDIFLALNRRGVTLLFSSHQLAEMERICSHVILMDRGRIVAAGRKDELLPSYGDGRDLEVEIDADAARGARVLAGLAGVQSVAVTGTASLRLRLAEGAEGRSRIERIRISRALAEAGAAVLSVRSKDITLEDLFLELTSGQRRRREEVHRSSVGMVA
ncbi:MAG TPA: ABC transporter ATP-binding protein [Bauldia sp.]|nr:ABC transporter ATP-binding protein [Bauldia sp.]